MSVELSTNGAADPVFYTWQYRHGIDDKRRIQIPARWRPAQPDARFTVTLWPNGNLIEACLMVRPWEQWLGLVRTMQGTRPGDSNAESLKRLIGGKSLVMELDTVGRIRLPEEMAKAAAIDEEALLVGLVDCFQIWNPQRFERVKITDEVAANEAFKLI